MADIRNPALERLRRNEVALGVGVRLARTVEIAKMMRASGYHWLFIDLEHGSLSLETVSQISIAALDAGIASIVRAPPGQWDVATRALDGGALGIVMPNIDTPEDAMAAVHHLRFPPVGHRGSVGGLPHFDYLPTKTMDVAREINAATLLVALIESPKAIANIDRIAQTPGIDVLLIGINDLAMSLGLEGDIENPAVMEAASAVIGAARRHNKWAGIGGISSEALLKKYIERGMLFIVAGADFVFMMSAAQQRARALIGS